MMSEQERQAHAEMQESYFDKKVGFFRQPIPHEVQKRTGEIIESAGLSEDSRVLDVATGVGVLIEHMLERGVPENNIVGCDLSATMLSEAKARFPDVTFWQGDFVDFPGTFGLFDAIFFNACFGNFFDQSKVIETAVRLLAPGGTVVISHPMGARFVAALHANEPEIVPHLLPDRDTLARWATLHSLELATFVDEPLIYIGILKRRS